MALKSVFRTVLAVAFWVVAAGAALPAVIKLTPAVQEAYLAWKSSGNWDVDALLAAGGASMPWLIVSAACVANATLVRILSTTDHF